MDPCNDCGSTLDREHEYVCEDCLRLRRMAVEACRAAKAPFMPTRRQPSGYEWHTKPDITLTGRARAKAEAHIAAVLRSS